MKATVIGGAKSRALYDAGITERGIEYLGHEKSTDFAYFGKIMLGLKEQTWFIDNAKTWLYCNSDDSDDPSEFDEEDMLVHYGIKVA